MSERQAKKFEGVAFKREQLKQAREQLKREQDSLARRKREIREKITKAKAKASPYHDKREEFVRIKAGRPIELNVSPRDRTEIPDAEGDAAESVGELREQGLGQVRLDVGVRDWNGFIQRKYGRGASSRFVDLPALMEKTKLASGFEVDRVSFEKIVKAYSKYTKKSLRETEADLKEFFSEGEQDKAGFAEAA